MCFVNYNSGGMDVGSHHTYGMIGANSKVGSGTYAPFVSVVDGGDPESNRQRNVHAATATPTSPPPPPPPPPRSMTKDSGLGPIRV